MNESIATHFDCCAVSPVLSFEFLFYVCGCAWFTTSCLLLMKVAQELFAWTHHSGLGTQIFLQQTSNENFEISNFSPYPSGKTAFDLQEPF